MSREVHVRFSEGLRVKSPRSTQPYIATARGWLYLTVFIDLFSRMVVGWALSSSLSTEMVLTALATRHP